MDIQNILVKYLKNLIKGTALVKKAKKLSIMIKEEDHIRIQTIYDI